MSKPVNSSEHDIAVGARLSALRRSYGITQSAAAKALGISQSNISQFESGKRRLSGEIALGFARLYHASLEEILGSTVQSKPAPPTPGEAETLLSELTADPVFSEISEATCAYIAVAAYRMLRALYCCNPHNSTELFSLDAAMSDELTLHFLEHEPSKLASLFRTMPTADRSKLELPVEYAARLRDMISSCEKLLIATDHET